MLSEKLSNCSKFEEQQLLKTKLIIVDIDGRIQMNMIIMEQDINSIDFYRF